MVRRHRGPRCHRNRWAEDANEVSHLIAGYRVTRRAGWDECQERQDRVAEVFESFVTLVMGDVLVLQTPESFDRVEGWAIGWDEVEFDPPAWPRHQACTSFAWWYLALSRNR